jgi:hypothetical protein
MHLNIISNTPSTRRSDPPSASLRSLSIIPPPLTQDILEINGQDQAKLRIVNSVSLESEVSNKDDTELSASVFDGQMQSAGRAMSPSMLFDFESYERL